MNFFLLILKAMNLSHSFLYFLRILFSPYFICYNLNIYPIHFSSNLIDSINYYVIIRTNFLGSKNYERI